MKRTAIYVRISQDREGAGLGVERQESDCRALADRLGWNVADVYVDNDVSAYNGRPRPAYQQMITDIKARKVNAVICWHTDRLHRSLAELEDYAKLPVATQTVQSGQLDLASPSGRMTAQILGAVAQHESAHKADRIKRAQQQSAQSGKWLGGAPPIGWHMHDDGTVTIDETAAERIRAASSAVVAGQSLGSIISQWNADGFTTGTGRQWNYTNMRQVLTRARNAGLTEYNGELFHESVFPAIVTEDTWRAVTDVFRNPTRRKSQSNRIKWMLAGLALCHCGSTVRSATAGAGRPYYRCRNGTGGGHVSRKVADVDDYVSRLVIARMSQANAAELLQPPGPDVSGLRDEADALRTRIRGAGDLWEDGTLTDADYRERVGRLRERLADVEGRMAAPGRAGALSGLVNAEDPGEAWRDMSIEQRRLAVDALMTVTLLPMTTQWRRVFHPELVQIDWKSG